MHKVVHKIFLFSLSKNHEHIYIGGTILKKKN